MPDPRAFGTDIQVSKKISKKAGPDVERRRQRFSEFIERQISSARRTQKKAASEQRRMEELAEAISASVNAQLEREQRVLSDWAKRQLERARQNLLSRVSEAEIPEEALRKAQDRYRRFAEFVLGLEEIR
ncbi:hypothetical protein DRQ05_03210 [bacterium]|nr:MAG: hypothetical protein DRQ05_03210 [bacterium]